jgi:hypothetical protein
MFKCGDEKCSNLGRNMFELGTKNVRIGDEASSNWGRKMFELGTKNVQIRGKNVQYTPSICFVFQCH